MVNQHYQHTHWLEREWDFIFGSDEPGNHRVDGGDFEVCVPLSLIFQLRL